MGSKLRTVASTLSYGLVVDRATRRKTSDPPVRDTFLTIPTPYSWPAIELIGTVPELQRSSTPTPTGSEEHGQQEDPSIRQDRNTS